MIKSNNKSFILVLPVILVSFIIAAMLNIYPLSASLAEYRPLSLMMVLLFWVIYQPRYVGLVVAFLIGLVADLLFDTTLGQQGLCAVLMLFALRFMVMSLKRTDSDGCLGFFTAWLFVSVSLIVFQLTFWMLQFTMQNVFVVESINGLILSVLAWPIIYVTLRGLRDSD